jgi:protein-disulfide isomerase
MTVSKRQEIKERNLRRKRRQQITMLLIFGGVVLALAAIIFAPSIARALRKPIERPMADGRTMGDASAPVLVEVFEDFQCPACQRYSDTTEKSLVESGYLEQGLVYYIFRQFPFIDDGSSSTESDQAANASMCASEQGMFWEYHDELYANWNGENLGTFNDNRLISFAERLGLEMDAFEACFAENRYQAEIDADLALGLQYGVNGTPSVFVNGQQIMPGYVPSWEDLDQAIQAALK